VHGLIGQLAPGKYVETEHGWGKIEYVGHGAVVISVFALRDDPGPQHAPEIDAEIAWRESGADDEPRFQRYEMTLVKTRSFLAHEGE
jgi:hypothetical protein